MNGMCDAVPIGLGVTFRRPGKMGSEADDDSEQTKARSLAECKNRP